VFERYKQVAFMPESDLSVINLSNEVKYHPDLTKYFIPKSVLKCVMDYKVMLPIMGEDHLEYHISRAWAITDPVLIACLQEQYNLAHGYHYEIATKTGDCGSLAFLYNSSAVNGKVLGMHVSGMNNEAKGTATAISREDVEKMIATYSPQQAQGEIELVDEIENEAKLPFKGNFTYYGTAKVPCPVATRTKIVKSPLYEKWGPALTAPAVLGPVRLDTGEMYDPRIKTIEKYGRELPSVDGKLLRRACSILVGLLVNDSNINVRHKPMVFDYDTAVKGMPGVRFCDAIPRHTSPGYPLNTQTPRSHTGKQWFFGKEDFYDLTREQAIELRNDVLHRISDLAKANRQNFVFMDCFKDERRSHEKVKAMSTRLVSACDLRLLILFRMYFMDFFMYVMENRIRNGICVGVNPYSPEWTELRTNILKLERILYQEITEAMILAR
jgi:hypothetical protein